MSEKKIVVPKGMLRAAKSAVHEVLSKGRQYEDLTGGRLLPLPDRDSVAVEAALRWQSENLPDPTDYEFGKVLVACRASVGIEAWEKATEWMRAGMLCHEWVRCMYDAPEEEPLDFGKVEYYSHISTETLAQHEWVKAEDYDRLLGAFRRVQESTSSRGV